jgi:hypothetical protein
VSADQFEPGVPLADQAFYHDLDFVLVNWELSLDYALTTWMNLDVRVPVRLASVDATFLNQHDEVLPDFNSIHHRDETLTGLGDIAFGARFDLLPADLVEGLMVLLSAGVTAPSGSTRPDPFVLGSDGQRHQHMFFGTGTIDPYLALVVAYDLSWMRLLGFVHGRASVYRNRYGYRGPGTVYAGIDGSSDFGLGTLVASAGVHVMSETPATWGDRNAENSGRTDLLIALGIAWQASDAWRLQTGVKIPVWTEAIGGQLDIPIIWDIGVRFTTNALQRDP